MHLATNRLNLTLLGGFLVTWSMIMKNMNVQTGANNSFLSKACNIIYIIGWSVVAYSIVMSSNKKYIAPIVLDRDNIIALIAIALILVSTIIMQNKNIAIFSAMYIIGWLLLGYNIGNYYSGLAALLVLGSVISVLPWQRKMCVVDGPGLAMFTTAWFLLAAGNSV